MILEDGNNIYSIFYFLHIFKNCISKIFSLVTHQYNFRPKNFQAQLQMNGILYMIKYSNNCITNQ